MQPNNATQIISFINRILNHTIPCIKNVDGFLKFIDPVDEREISTHYGVTHMAASLMIFGEYTNNKSLFVLGEKLLTSFLKRWTLFSKKQEFHNDFNNFALCLIYNYTSCDAEIKKEIKDLVISTSDSSHDTINWIPMRWYVNHCRFAWTKDKNYLKKCASFNRLIQSATYPDGFVDDRLPKGTSFNLQYDVSTISTLQFLNINNIEFDISKQFGALLNSVFPDGDINYFGRGTNQIFAWGPWVYLLSSSGSDELSRALSFLKNKIGSMLENNNLMLNNSSGKDKCLWWDYHHCSVYTAHFLLWLVLSLKDMDKRIVEPKLITDGSSGINIFRDDNFFVVIFKGRKEYLAERGPSVVAIWTRENGNVVKGEFGPWLGSFGNNHCSCGYTIMNFCGLFEKKQYPISFKNLLLRKLFHKGLFSYKETIKPVFVDTRIVHENGKLFVVWTAKKHRKLFFSIPTMCENFHYELYVNDEQVSLKKRIRFENQYSWVNLQQSDVKRGKEWKLMIE